MQSFFFDCRGRTKCHGKNSPRISAFAFKYKKNKEMPQVQAANARTHSGKMPTTHGRIDVFLSHIIFSLTFGSLKFKGHFPLSCCVLQSYGLIATRICISMIPYFLEEQPERLLSFSHNKGAIIHYEVYLSFDVRG